MSHQAPDFETKDVLGKSIPYVGSVGTSNLTLPPSAVGKISEFLVRNPNSNSITTTLSFSIDGGSNFLVLGRGEFCGWTLKNNASNSPITSIVIKGSSATTNYEVLINFEP